jgi:SAM-dependent methyltransferase
MVALGGASITVSRSRRHRFSPGPFERLRAVMLERFLQRAVNAVHERSGRRMPLRERMGLTGLQPVSRTFGFERGRPIDRHYIEMFLSQHADDVRGRVLEVAEPTYTQWYGGADVTHSEVLHAAAGNPQATLIGDLTTGSGIPERRFDCIILTQTLPFIYDVRAAVAGVHRALAPGGVVLATLPGLSQTSRVDKSEWGDYWRFTSDSARRLFGDVFGADRVDTQAHGNVLTACAFLYGFAAEELHPHELEARDEDYELLITVRARRAG